jgi:ABC-type transport system involved in multi-copper enzyme maturation permease subunit
MPFAASRIALLVSLRETRILRRTRAGRFAAVLIFALAWLPPLLVSARSGRLGLASFEETAPLTLALLGVLVPLLALLAGCGLFANEIEDRSIVPVLTAPVSRRVCAAGKLLGLGSVLGAVYAAAFLSVAAAISSLTGARGARDFLAIVVSGALLGTSCLLVGAALGASGRGRVRAFGSALVCWLLLVFALDGLLLASVLATSPPPPASVGHHGHSELQSELSEVTSNAPHVLLLAAAPVDLFRLSVFTFAPELGAPWRELTHESATLTAIALGFGWLLWLLAPAAAVLYRFRRLALG